VEKQPSGVKVGLVSFSDGANLLEPPTTEKERVIRAINNLSPQRGTNIGAGIEVALQAIYQEADIAFQPSQSSVRPLPTPTDTAGQKPPPASIVLVSDGQSTVGPDPLDIADEAVKAGVKVYTIGIGTQQGTNLLIQGRVVFTRLDEDALKGVARKTDARYYSAQDTSSLRQIYDELSRNREFESKKTEVTFAFAGFAMVVSVLAGGLGLLWFNRLP
jgi:Ca-activated chloride channel family protein